MIFFRCAPQFSSTIIDGIASTIAPLSLQPIIRSICQSDLSLPLLMKNNPTSANIVCVHSAFFCPRYVSLLNHRHHTKLLIHPSRSLTLYWNVRRLWFYWIYSLQNNNSKNDSDEGIEAKVQSIKIINHHYTQTQQSATERGNYNNFYYIIAQGHQKIIIWKLRRDYYQMQPHPCPTKPWDSTTHNFVGGGIQGNTTINDWLQRMMLSWGWFCQDPTMKMV